MQSYTVTSLSDYSFIFIIISMSPMNKLNEDIL